LAYARRGGMGAANAPPDRTRQGPICLRPAGDRGDPAPRGGLRPDHGRDLPGHRGGDRARSLPPAQEARGAQQQGEALRHAQVMAAGPVGVVGGGLAGLSAALELKRLGFEVELLERSRLLGGKATSFEVAGVEVDNGQHVYLACRTEFVDFMQQLGYVCSGEGAPLFLQERFEALLLARGRRPARLRAAPLPAPWHLLPALLRYPYLGPVSRLQLGRALLAARRPARPGETFADWLARHHQSAAVRRAFWEPFLVPALNAPLHEGSAETALFVIITAFLPDAGAARFGYASVHLARIAESAAQRIDRVYLRTP